MSFDKTDLATLEKLFEKSEAKLSDKIEDAVEKSEAKIESKFSKKLEILFEKQEVRLSDKIDFSISQSELRMENRLQEVVGEAKEEILEQLHSEVSAMTEMHAKETETLEDHESRITKIESKLKLTV